MDGDPPLLKRQRHGTQSHRTNCHTHYHQLCLGTGGWVASCRNFVSAMRAAAGYTMLAQDSVSVGPPARCLGSMRQAVRGVGHRYTHGETHAISINDTVAAVLYHAIDMRHRQ